MTLIVCDVGPRDGLQNEPDTVPPGIRAELVDRLVRAGLPRVEAVSFVRPERVPQMAGAEEVVAAVERRDGAELAGVVLNEQGYRRLAQTGLDRVNVTLAATDSFSERNAGMSRDEALRQTHAILEAARLDGRSATATVSVAFGCPFEGPVDPRSRRRARRGARRRR
jgi:hydroxymethylglutaryl-CoA lyase